MQAWMKPSLKAQPSAAWCSSKGTAQSAACARRSTTRCLSRACSAWSPTCRSSRKNVAKAKKCEILVINQIAQVGLKRFPAERYAVVKESKDPWAILVRSQDLHQYEFGPSLRALGRAGAGVNNIPVAALSKRGIPVFNAPGANANAVKELVLAGMLMAARNLVPAVRFVGSLNCDDETLAKRVEAEKKQFAGIELPQQTLGVIGLGKIGSLVADAAIKLGMNVLGYDPEITVE